MARQWPTASSRASARAAPSSPTLVLDQQGQVQMAVGSPGGSLIIHYVAQALLGLLEWRLDPQAAANLPHYGSRNGPTELEADQQLERLIEPLRQRGHEVKLTPMTSGLSIIVRQPQGGYLGEGTAPRSRYQAFDATHKILPAWQGPCDFALSAVTRPPESRRWVLWMQIIGAACRRRPWPCRPGRYGAGIPAPER